MAYIARISDGELRRKLNASGAVLIRGPKSCGKTESAKQLAGSILRVDQDEQVPLLMDAAPERLLLGETPRLIDEWQEQPRLWQLIRHEIDERKARAQFILTGSANPEESAKMHSGAGRFTTLDMRTMSWREMGLSSGKTSLAALLKNATASAATTTAAAAADKPLRLEFIAEKIATGGFPGLAGAGVSEALEVHRGYIDLLAEVDMSRVSNIRRDPQKVRNLLRSLARNTATCVEVTTLAADIGENEKTPLSRPSIIEYLGALDRLMITEAQPAWNTHIRSSSSLRKAPKRHFADPCLAVAALGADVETLLNDIKFTGFLFESLATHDLRVYAQAADAAVYYYRDSSGLEADAIVQKRNGDWAAFEIKLGTGQIDEAARNLKKLASIMDPKKVPPPKSLNIITGTGATHTRPDGVNVISIASLGE